MAINALVRRHLATPANPVATFKLRYLPLLTAEVRSWHRAACACEPDAWRVGRGVGKLGHIEESCTYDLRTDGRVNMMLKKEVTPVSYSEPEYPKKARGIQFNTNLRTAYEFAPEQFSLCHALAKASRPPRVVDGVKFNVVYTADMNLAEVARFATESEALRGSYKCSVLDERDGKNWDANVQTVHREALAEWYSLIHPTLAKVARANIQVRGTYRKGDFRLTYDVNGTVKSGHFDTSSGNGALNLEVTISAILGLPTKLRPAAVRGLVMGDDLLLWLYFDQVVDFKEYAAAIAALEAGLGIQPVRGLFDNVLNVSFCSLGFYWSHEGLVAVPKLGRTFAKLFWTVTPLQGRDPARLASTIAASFYPLFHEYAPMREFLRHHMKAPPLEKELVDEHMPYLSWIAGEQSLSALSGVHWDSGNQVKYGLLSGTLGDMPDVLNDCPTGLVSHPAVDIMLQQDLSDPPERRGCLAY